jgi:hypothetical protein
MLTSTLLITDPNSTNDIREFNNVRYKSTKMGTAAPELITGNIILVSPELNGEVELGLLQRSSSRYFRILAGLRSNLRNLNGKLFDVPSDSKIWCIVQITVDLILRSRHVASKMLKLRHWIIRDQWTLLASEVFRSILVVIEDNCYHRSKSRRHHDSSFVLVVVSQFVG